MFGRIEDWRSIAMPYDVCHDLFMGAAVLAAMFMFRLGRIQCPRILGDDGSPDGSLQHLGERFGNVRRP